MRLTVASLYSFPLTVLKSSASATDADNVAEIASIAYQDFSLPGKKRDLSRQRITHCEIANTANASAALMSAEIILPACHHFNAEPALQAPKTSAAFKPCATVMRLTSPQTAELPVPLPKNAISFSCAFKTELVSRLSLFTSDHFLILPSAFFLSVLAKAISLKDYSSFFRSKETPAG